MLAARHVVVAKPIRGLGDSPDVLDGGVLFPLQCRPGGRLDGAALRVPVPDGSITDFTVVLPGEVTVEQVNAAFVTAATSGPLSKVLVYTEDPIVSSDIVGSPASCTFDAGLTMVMPSASGVTLVKVQGWYDNEWGYANRLVDLSLIVGAGA